MGAGRRTSSADPAAKANAGVMVAEPANAPGAAQRCVGILHQQRRYHRRGVGRIGASAQKAPPLRIHIVRGMEIFIARIINHLSTIEDKGCRML